MQYTQLVGFGNVQHQPISSYSKNQHGIPLNNEISTLQRHTSYPDFEKVMQQSQKLIQQVDVLLSPQVTQTQEKSELLPKTRQKKRNSIASMRKERSQLIKQLYQEQRYQFYQNNSHNLELIKLENENGKTELNFNIQKNQSPIQNNLTTHQPVEKSHNHQTHYNLIQAELTVNSSGNLNKTDQLRQIPNRINENYKINYDQNLKINGTHENGKNTPIILNVQQDRYNFGIVARQTSPVNQTELILNHRNQDQQYKNSLSNNQQGNTKFTTDSLSPKISKLNLNVPEKNSADQLADFKSDRSKTLQLSPQERIKLNGSNNQLRQAKHLNNILYQEQILKPNQSKYNGFCIEKELGTGIYSKVYLARHEITGFQVALKIILKSKILKERMESQIANEIRIQHLIQHPNIVRLYTFFQNFLEYCPSGELFGILQKANRGRFIEAVSANYVKQVATGLSFLHQNHIIHRDIKPENILISNGVAKIADFTFSIHSPDKQQTSQCGSVVYSSPQVITGEKYDTQTDVWALGILAYELCYGQTPWENLNKEDTAAAILRNRIKYPPFFSKFLRNFIDCLTKQNSNERLTAKQSLQHPWINQFQMNGAMSWRIKEFKDSM